MYGFQIKKRKIMAVSRMKRVNELLKREIAENLYKNFINTNFDSSSVTVTRVECSPDLRDANVFVSIFGHDNERHKMIKELNYRKQEIIRLMIKRISLKYTPKLHFHLDDSLEKGDNILSILDEINKNKK